MEVEKIKEILKNKNEMFIFEINLISKKFIQAIRLERNKVKIIYYEEKEDNLIKVENENTLNYLKNQYELKASPIIYAKYNSDNYEYNESDDEPDEELKEWVQNYVIDVLSECEPFTNVFGKSFARHNIKKIKKVCITEKKKEITICGRYDSKEESVTLFLEPEILEEFSYMYIEDNDECRSTIVHEAIHALLKRNLNGTGLLVLIKSNDEIGRAINEGYTEWILRKVGLGEDISDLYEIFLNDVQKIELAIGEQNTMKLGKRTKYFV